MDALSGAIVLLNDWGRVCCGFAGRMLLQSSILVGLLLIADSCLRARVSARFRYGMWLLVLVKLMLPPSLALPTGAAYWLSGYLPAAPAPSASFTPTVWVALPSVVEPSHEMGSMPVARLVEPVAARHVASLQWQGLMLLGWMVGVLSLLMVVLWRIASVRRFLVRSRPAGARMVALLEQCRAELGVAARVELKLTDDMHSPAVCGFRRPVILLPAVLPPGLWPEGLRMIFTHELAHVKRRDPWVNLAQTVLQVVYFWHPLVWAANAVLRYLRELAVDETVIVKLRLQTQCYTDTLIDIAEMAFRKPAFSLRLIGIAESKRALERRITHMLSRHTSKRPSLGLSGLLAILAMGAVLVPMGRGTMAARAEQNATATVPALPPGIAGLFDLSEDDILKKFGPPKHIFLGDETYTLDNLPDEYLLSYEDISFAMGDGVVGGITVISPVYVFGNGIHVGDSEEKVKQAFGPPSEIQETEWKDFLTYEALGLSFEVKKDDRSVMEINIGRGYIDPVNIEAYARADEFAASLPEKIAKFDIDTADLEQVLAAFGQPVKYAWGMKEMLPPDRLPNRFIMVYPAYFQVVMLNNRVVELRHEQGSPYVFAGKLRLGGTLEEALAVLGAPAQTVEGKPIDWSDSKNVLFKDIGGRKGHCYYHRPDQGVCIWFGNYKVTAIYMTRSDYGADDSLTAGEAEFARLLQGRVDTLDIESAGLEQVRATFGEPNRYGWGSQTFQRDALPDNYIMFYPCGFDVLLRNGRIMEIRHQRHGQGSPYVYRGVLRIGSTMEEAVALLGEPTETVTGQKNEFKDGVLYRDANGEEGTGYYHRSDQKIRLFFAKNKVIAIYMTRSDL